MSYLYTFLASFVIAFGLSPLVVKFAKAKKILKYPKRNRDVHTEPVPLLGGTAIIISFALAVFLNYLLNPNFIVTIEVIGLTAGIVIVAVMGILDDVYDLKPVIKAAFQFAAAITTVAISGSKIAYFTNLGSKNNLVYLPDIISFIATVLWIFMLTNAFNIIDGLDGLTTGTAIICSLTLFFVTFVRPDAGLVGEYIPILLIALSGAAAGFLPFNFNPAKLYLGETGAAFLGFCIAVISIQGTMKAHAAIAVFIPLIAMGLPILDISLAYFRRIIMKKPIAVGDRDHIHHRLMKMGLSQKKTVLILYLLDIVFGVTAFILSGEQYSRFWLYFAIVIILLGISIYILYGPLLKQAAKNGNGYVKDEEYKHDKDD
ncbi:MAG TPA: MraY family glycosyltransferase [Clostridia bacterium]|nr:MraY family glycosyltransferase [Clostridia bacterium]